MPALIPPGLTTDSVNCMMFLPEPDAWPYTNLLESIYRGASTTTNTDGTLSRIAAAHRARGERRVVEGWENEQVQQREGENSETKEVRRKLPERALRILHRVYLPSYSHIQLYSCMFATYSILPKHIPQPNTRPTNRPPRLHPHRHARCRVVWAQ